MAKTREYSDEFPSDAKKRHAIMVDKVPPALYRAIKAKAKREGVSLRALILRWLKAWVDQ